ncbi:MAG TPA: DUF192 domain-containing protein [Labilithrix sp.]|nr:DUF192 domain-containing protein [Labilithrix sp.]
MSPRSALLRPSLFGAASLVGVIAGLGCSRTPPEPAPNPAPVQPTPKLSSASAEHAAAAPARCITPLPASAPKLPPPLDPAMCPPDPEPNRKPALADVTFPDAPNAPRVEVELAKSPHDVERGLMYRRSMPEDHGMLFTLDGRREHTFWMHNTCISLDMMFIDDDGVIVGIVEGAAPLTETTRSVGCPSVFVLEMNGGWARKHGVAPGQRITIPFAAR